MAKSELKLLARVHRHNGKGIKTIAHELKVSSSTVSLWCKDIKLTEEQIIQLEKNSHDPFYGKRLDYSLRQQEKRKFKNSEIKTEALKLIGNLSDRDILMSGAALYWAEGFKKDKMVGFSNSDPVMVRFILKWFRNCMGVRDEMVKLRVVINESHKHREEDIRDYWEKVTKIPKEEFYRTTFQKVNWKKTYEKPEEYFGILRVRVLKSTDLLRKILGLIEGLGANIAVNNRKQS
jgi:hypothetical protein